MIYQMKKEYFFEDFLRYLDETNITLVPTGICTKEKGNRTGKDKNLEGTGYPITTKSFSMHPLTVEKDVIVEPDYSLNIHFYVPAFSFILQTEETSGGFEFTVDSFECDFRTENWNKFPPNVTFENFQDFLEGAEDSLCECIEEGMNAAMNFPKNWAFSYLEGPKWKIETEKNVDFLFDTTHTKLRKETN